MRDFLYYRCRGSDVTVLVVSEFAATRRSDPGDDGLVRSFQASHESTVELEPQDGTPNGNLLNNLEP
jgi:hypothetical protein